jgi:hypothetical protein
MKTRTLIVLGCLCVLMAALVLWGLKRAQPGPPPDVGGRLLLTDDINTVNRIEIASGAQTVRLARADAGWTVESRWNYPAQFDRIADLLRDLDQLRVAEIIRGGAEILPEVGLVEDGTNFPARIRLYAGSDKPTDEILLGKPRAGAAMPRGFHLPDSRYARRAQGPVVLVEPFLHDVSPRPSDWLRAAVLDIRASDIVRMMAVPTNDIMYAVARAEGGGYSGLGGLLDQSINTPSADLWFRAFQGVVVRDVVDPALGRENFGSAEAELVAAYVKNGLVVRVELGRETGEEGLRYAWFSFDYEGPEEGGDNFSEEHKAARAEQERLNQDVAPWTFLLSDSQASAFLMLREQLIAAAPAADP